jgi:hypothetical protein
LATDEGDAERAKDLHQQHAEPIAHWVCFFCNDTELEKNQRIMTHRT